MIPIIFGICLWLALCVCGYFWLQIITGYRREIANSQEIAAIIRGENDEWHATAIRLPIKGWSEKRASLLKEFYLQVADEISVDEPTSVTTLYPYMTTDYVFTDLTAWNWMDEIAEISKFIKHK